MLIRPPSGLRMLPIADLWRYRELLWFLALRDVIVRYKQTMLGAVWAVIPPLMQMAVFGTLFALLMGAAPTVENVPYPISTFCALVPWTLFANAISKSGVSIVNNRNLITKVYFPRLIAPAAPILAAAVDFAIAFVVLCAIIACFEIFNWAPDYQFQATWALLLLPAFVLMTMLAALAVSLWLAALNAIYRDIGYVTRFLVQIWMYITPTIYPAERIRDGLESRLGEDGAAVAMNIYYLNPMAGVVEGFRWAMLGQAPPSPVLLLTSAGIVLVLLVGGMFYFRHMERYFADLV